MKKADGNKSESTKQIENCLDYYEIRVKRSLRDPKFVLEFAGFIVLFIYAIYTIRMFYANRDSADAAKRSADVARDTLTTIQRPFVTFSPAATVRTKNVPTSPDNPTGIMWIFNFPIHNTGTSPTSQMFDHTNLYYSGSKPIDDSFDYRDVGDLQPFNIILTPNDTVHGQPVEVTPNWLYNVMYRWARGEYWHGAHLYFYGWVRYRDMIPSTPEHLTMFCFELTHFDQNPAKPAVSDHLGVEVSFCHRHNCMDDNCKNEVGVPPEFQFGK
jgi:hypothetical protein